MNEYWCVFCGLTSDVEDTFYNGKKSVKCSNCDAIVMEVGKNEISKIS